MRLIWRVLGIILGGLAVLYVADYLSARFRLPGNRQTLQSVQIQPMWAIKTKNGRIDYSLGDSQTVTCLVSLFPHLGYQPCWYLRRHRNPVITVGFIPEGAPLSPPRPPALISC